MRKDTHVLLGFAVGMYLGWDLESSMIAAVVSSIGASIPDIDLKFKHRKTLHNIFAMAVLVTIVLLVSWFTGSPRRESLLVVSALAAGWLSHVLSDMLNYQKVFIFYPFSDFSVALGVARSNNPVLNMLLSAGAAALIYLRLRELGVVV